MDKRKPRPILSAFRLLVHALMRGSALVTAVILSIILGCAIRFGIPALINAAPLLSFLDDHALLLDALLYLITPFLMMSACCMVMLEERDNATALGLMTTPIGRSGYLISRSLLPLCCATLYTAVIVFLFSSAPRAPLHALLTAITASLSAYAACAFIPEFARDRVSGMSMMKVGFLLILTVAIPFFAPQKWGPYLSWLPTYWFYRTLIFCDWLMAIINALVSAIWIFPSLLTFRRRALRPLSKL